MKINKKTKCIQYVFYKKFRDKSEKNTILTGGQWRKRKILIDNE